MAVARAYNSYLLKQMPVKTSALRLAGTKTLERAHHEMVLTKCSTQYDRYILKPVHTKGGTR